MVTVNSVMVFEEKNISPVMVQDDRKMDFFCSIPLKKEKNTSTLKLLQQHFDTLLPCFYGSYSHFIAWDERNLRVSNDRVEVIIEPIYFTVDFKEDFATIRAIR